MNATIKLRILILSLLLLPAVAAAGNDTFEQALTVPEGTLVEVDTGSGSIEISGGPGRDVTVIGKVRVNRNSFWRRSADREEILAEVLANPPVQLEGDRLSIGHIADRGIRKRVSISYVIVVPADTSVDAESGSGSISVSDIAAPVEVSAGSGRLTLENIGGPVRASAGSGRISLSQIAPGDVTASTGSGRIDLTGVDGALEASTGSGGIRVEGRQRGDWQLDTGSGSVTVRLPDDAAFALDAESRSGGITVDHPLTVLGNVSKRHIRGEVRGGGPLLRIDTGSGGIRIE